MEIMIGTVIVGVIISLMFLVSFSEWFYHLVIGIDELLVKDLYIYYRISLWVGGGILFMAIVFWSLAMVKECPMMREKEGVFKYLNCSAYWQVRSRFEGVSSETIQERILIEQEQNREEELKKWL